MVHTCSLDIANSEISDWDTSGWLSSWRTVLVVLLDDDTVLGDVLEGDVLVGDARDGTGGTRDGLDTDTVVGIADGGGGDGDIFDDVVITATDTADGQTVTTGASSTGEGDVLQCVSGCYHDGEN